MEDGYYLGKDLIERVYSLHYENPYKPSEDECKRLYDLLGINLSLISEEEYPQINSLYNQVADDLHWYGIENHVSVKNARVGALNALHKVLMKTLNPYRIHFNKVSSI